MLSRNRELFWLAATYTALAVFLSAAAATLGHTEAALWVLGSAALLAIPFALFTRARYRAIALLASGLDDRLHGDRPLQLASMHEGELAILASELEKTVQRLDLATEQLAAERNRLSDSLADISHQIKTPMTSLSIMTELVRKRIATKAGDLTDDDIADIMECLRTIEQLENRVQGLVANLLKLARLDAGVIHLAKRHVDASELARTAAAPPSPSLSILRTYG